MVFETTIKDQFTQLLVQGKTIREIKEQHLQNLTLKTLYRWKFKLSDEGNLRPKKASGRPIKTSARDERHLIRIVKNAPSLSIKQAINESNIDISHKTAVKILAKSSIISFKALKRPLLTPIHIDKRLDFANLHVDKTVDDWTRWTFSDESMVDLDCAEGNVRFLITRNQRLEPEFIAGKKQMGGGKLMIWSFISHNGVGPLIFINGGMDAALYIEILKHHVVEHCVANLGEDGRLHYYQDDGASCHDAHAVIDFCAQKGIHRPNWPPNSPDMNPIEWMWGWMKNKLTARRVKPRNIEELKTIIAEIWYSFTPTQVKGLYASMPGRIATLQRLNGKNTNF